LATHSRDDRTFRHSSFGGCGGSEFAQFSLPSTGDAAIADADFHGHADVADSVAFTLSVADANRKRQAVAQAEREPAQVPNAIA
jgi:hypothetical protein